MIIFLQLNMQMWRVVFIEFVFAVKIKKAPAGAGDCNSFS